ncbi:unnamed protein product, partial [Coregonus sp. 'balchen']
MSLPRNRTLENGITQLHHINNGEPLSSLQFHLQHTVLVTAQNLIIALVNSTLVSIVFGTIMTPALVMVVFGFLCHSTVQPNGTSLYCSDLLDDGGCVALLVVGFILVTPLLVLALTAYCRLAQHLQLGLCFIPYCRAVYKNLRATVEGAAAASRGPQRGRAKAACGCEGRLRLGLGVK